VVQLYSTMNRQKMIDRLKRQHFRLTEGRTANIEFAAILADEYLFGFLLLTSSSVFQLVSVACGQLYNNSPAAIPERYRSLGTVLQLSDTTLKYTMK
jgi:hypothetical protein